GEAQIPEVRRGDGMQDPLLDVVHPERTRQEEELRQVRADLVTGSEAAEQQVRRDLAGGILRNLGVGAIGGEIRRCGGGGRIRRVARERDIAQQRHPVVLCDLCGFLAAIEGRGRWYLEGRAVCPFHLEGKSGLRVGELAVSTQGDRFE